MEGQHLPKAARGRISARARDARARFGLERDEARTPPDPTLPRVLTLEQLAIPLSDQDVPVDISLRYDPLSA